MKKTYQLYIPLTNKCNTRCPFCFFYSGPKNDIFMSLETFVNIIDNNWVDRKITLQLEGGEPLLSPILLQIIEEGFKRNNIQNIAINTNGILLSKYINECKIIADKYNKKIFFKISVNYWLCQNFPEHLKKIDNLIQNYSSENIQFCLSIRKRYPPNIDSDLLNLNEYKSIQNSSKIIHYLEFIGRGREEKVPNLSLSNNISPSYCYYQVFSSDGINFGEDFDKRMEHERTLSKELL